jgi:hypothetical protein
MPRMEHTTTTTGERRHVKGLTNLHPFKKLNPYAAKSAPMKKKKTLRNAGDVIKAYLADYAVHAEKTINGKGFGLFVMEDTTDKHVNYARRVLMHVANENTTDVEALLALLARTNMDSLIATIALNVQTGLGGLHSKRRRVAGLQFSVLAAALPALGWPRGLLLGAAGAWSNSAFDIDLGLFFWGGGTFSQVSSTVATPMVVPQCGGHRMPRGVAPIRNVTLCIGWCPFGAPAITP